MPQTRNIDEESAEGAIDYTIGGKVWRAEEPTMDTFKAVLEAAAEGRPAPPAEGQASKPEEADPDATMKSLETMIPQLQLLLRAVDEQGVPTKTAPTADYLRKHLSVRKAGSILQQVLGEGQGAAV